MSATIYNEDKIVIRGTHIRIALWFVLALSLLLQSCGGGGSGTAGGTTGTLNILLTDDATDQFNEINVTIEEIHVHHEMNGWVILSAPDLELPQTFNLLKLVNGVMADLGSVEIEAGHYTQMRLILLEDSELPENTEPPYANYLVDSAETAIPLKVPSGNQTGIKLVNGFDIVDAAATKLVLDFDALRSIVRKGNGTFSLKPTIKVLETLENSVSGAVDDGSEPEVGAFVSAQIYDSGAVLKKDVVIVESTTQTMNTEETYNYKFYLPPDIYNIVVTRDGFLPACKEVDAQYYDNEIVDFSLVPEAGYTTITGTVSGLATEEDSARLSFRQRDVNCGGDEIVTIEVASVNTANGEFSVALPAGTYHLVAYAEGYITQVLDVPVVASPGETVLDVDFSPVP